MAGAQQKAAIKKLYGEITSLQQRTRALASTSRLDVKLRRDPGVPDNADDLKEALGELRANMLLVENALNDLDRERNGPEIRTRSQIEADIASDEELLRGPLPARPARTRETIERNLRYDRLQLRRHGA